MKSRVIHIYCFTLLAMGLLFASYAHASPDSVIYINESRTSLGEDALLLRGSPTELHVRHIPEIYESGAFKRSGNETPSFGLTDDVLWVALP